MPPVLVAVMGATATGKSDLAEELADALDADLINADAFQVYRGLDIGTAKPLHKQRYHLLDLKDPNEGYGVGEFCQNAQGLLDKLWDRSRSAVVVGGTGLYIRALFEEYAGLRPSPPAALRQKMQDDLASLGLEAMQKRLLELDPSAADKLDMMNPLRVTRAIERLISDAPAVAVNLPAYARVKLAVGGELQEVYERIATRVQWMVQNGWVEEVRALLQQGFQITDPGFRAIGYRELAESVLGHRDLEEAIATTIAETRRYAKRQETWLRSEPRLIRLESTGTARLQGALAAIRSELQ